MINPHIHTPDDGRGPRSVYVNGNLIKYAIWADTRSGVVWFHPHPLRRQKGRDFAYARKLRGVVTVGPLNV